MRRFFLFFVAVLALFSSCGVPKSELRRIRVGEGIMPLMTIDNYQDSLFLRKKAIVVSSKFLRSDDYIRLRNRMLATVNDPENKGVGIAAPQVGVSIRLIAVQRLDKEGEPFIFYINPRITYHSQEMVVGREGCLSIPNRAEQVSRWTEVTVSYIDETTFEMETERVSGYVARIFQHEIDHLNGILYIDYSPAQ